jgi:hypothetical protein
MVPEVSEGSGASMTSPGVDRSARRAKGIHVLGEVCIDSIAIRNLKSHFCTIHEAIGGKEDCQNRLSPWMPVTEQ